MSSRRRCKVERRAECRAKPPLRMTVCHVSIVTRRSTDRDVVLRHVLEQTVVDQLDVVVDEIEVRSPPASVAIPADARTGITPARA